MQSESLEKTEAECAEGRTAPRVRLDDIKNAIAYETYRTGNVFFPDAIESGGDEEKAYDAAKLLTICLIVMKNGFTIIGKAAPASPANFDAELGKKLAYEDAVRQIWPLMGFALRDKLAQQRW